MRPLRNSPPPDSGRRSSRLSSCSTFTPESEPFSATRLAVPLNVWVSASTLPPAASTANTSVPLPSIRRMPNRSRRQLSKSTLPNCNCDLISAPAEERASPRDPRSTPPNAWDSPIASVRRPSRRLAPIAVRPSLAFPRLMRAAESRRSTSKSAKPSSTIGSRLHSRPPVRSPWAVEI